MTHVGKNSGTTEAKTKVPYPCDPAIKKSIPTSLWQTLGARRQSKLIGDIPNISQA